MNFTSLDNLERFLNKLSFATKESGVLNSIINSYLNDFKDDLVRIVQELPQSGEDGILYLVPQGNDRFIEYYYNNEWIQLGSSVFDYTVDSTLSNNSSNTIQNSTIKNALDSKLNANQVVNALNDSSNETPQSGVIYNSLEEKVTSSDFLNIQNSEINKLFLASEQYFDFEITIPEDACLKHSYSGSYLESNGTYADEGDDTEYEHFIVKDAAGDYGIQMAYFKFNDLNFKSYSNLTANSMDCIFTDSDLNEYRAQVTLQNNACLSPPSDYYYLNRAFYGQTTSGYDLMIPGKNGTNKKDLKMKIHFLDKINFENIDMGFSFNTTNEHKMANIVCARVGNIKVKASENLTDYTTLMDISNIWQTEFKYIQNVSYPSLTVNKFKFTINLDF